MTGQMMANIEQAEKAVGQPFIDELFIEGAKNEIKAYDMWTQIMVLNQAVPAPMDEKTMFSFIVPNLTRPNDPETYAFMKELRDEVQDRVDRGIAAMANEQFRIIMDAIPPWSALELYRYLEKEYGAVVVGSPYVYGFDSVEGAGEKAVAFATKNLDGRVKKGKMTEDEKAGILGNITLVDKMEDLGDVDLVIEAVFEDLKIKQDIFKQLSEVVKPSCILASNTSALQATPMASVLPEDRQGNFIIIHFHQPPTHMKLVEVVCALQTTDETGEASVQFCKEIGKEACDIKVDCPGFLTNRTMAPLLNEVAYCLL